MAVTTTSSDPLFGRSNWSYVTVVPGPVRGPQPRLARGTGRTGAKTSGTGAQLPGYLSDNAYRMSPLEYQPSKPTPFFQVGPHTVHTEVPRFREILTKERSGTAANASQLESTYQTNSGDAFLQVIPRTIDTGENGRELVGTYQPHDFIPGQRFFHQKRSAPNWQLWAYPPSFRNIIQWQQVQKYRVKSHTISAQPLSSSNYFLGYQVQPEIGAQIGQNTLGYMGSV
jgi:hypothetical protein